MSDQPEVQPSVSPAESAWEQWEAAGRRRSPWAYVLVGVVSLAMGAGAMFLALRGMRGSAPGGAPDAPASNQARQEPAAPASGPPSDKAIFISPARQQLIGVRTALVEPRALETTIRTVGVLEYDETRVAEIHTKVAGWLESVSVDFVGKRVQRGQPLFSVYSPDLVATQKEYLFALKAVEQLGASPQPETRESARSLLAATRERLRLWDITDAQVADLERTREPRRTLTIYSPFDGIVLERKAFPGQYITPETSTFRIASLSTIWVIAQIFEYEMSSVKLGQPAEVRFPYGSSDRMLAGRITFVYPEVDAMTRRVKVRIELPNPGFEFKPASYVTVVIRSGGGQRLAVPKEAVIDTGDRRYALLALEDGYFEPREIQVGEPTDASYPVLSGLRQGDRVVTSAQFLIDSETNLQAAMQAMAGLPGPEPGGQEAAAQKPAPPSGREPAPAPARLSITFRSQPDPPRVGENGLEVVVRDADGKPVTDAQVTVTFFMPPMPSMGMPAMRTTATLSDAGDGVYRGAGQVAAAGRWDVTVTVTRAGQRIGSRRVAVVVQ